MNLNFWKTLTLCFFTTSMVQAQNAIPENWFNLDKVNEEVQAGVNVEQAYTTLLKGKKGQTIIVAVIDSGVDVEHEDLKQVIWRNTDEIAGNGIDDDKNGYIDDVNGWNFLGGKDGQNVNQETLELVRIYKKLKAKYEDKKPTQIGKKDKKEFALYQQTKQRIEKEREEASTNLAQYESIKPIILESLNVVEEALKGKQPTIANVTALQGGLDQLLDVGKGVVLDVLNQGAEVASMEDVKAEMDGQLQEGIDHFSEQLDYNLNLEFDARKIVGDDYENQTEKGYGNNDVEGPDATHGTHVAGIIGAVRNNDIGMNGVADNIQIMPIRAVPNGDERDKDVANAIRYAVDNGASVINMSFGKDYAWNKKIVDNAVRYAAKKDVLIVHAAGNDSREIEAKNNFPNDVYAKKKLFGAKKAKNWIEVGALSWKVGENSIASFSNYDKANVDLFAPGEKIYSTIPDSKYKNLQGTSMAAPVVAGVAAVLRSYFPKLSAAQVKQILLESVAPLKMEVIKPGTEGEKVPFSSLSVTGGAVNAYQAVKKATMVKGKKKGKKASGKSGSGNTVTSGKKKEKVA